MRLSTGRVTIKKAFNDQKFADFPRVACLINVCSIAFEGINVLAYDKFLGPNHKPKYVGIIMTDFPGDGLINAIINVNHN